MKSIYLDMVYMELDQILIKALTEKKDGAVIRFLQSVQKI